MAKERERASYLEAEISYRKEDRIQRYTESSPQRSTLPTGVTSAPHPLPQQASDEKAVAYMAETELLVNELET